MEASAQVREPDTLENLTALLSTIGINEDHWLYAGVWQGSWESGLHGRRLPNICTNFATLERMLKN